MNKWFIKNDDIHREVFMFDVEQIKMSPLSFDTDEFVKSLTSDDEFYFEKVLEGSNYDIYTTHKYIACAFDKRNGNYKLFWIPPDHPAGSTSSIEYKYKFTSENVVEFENYYETLAYDLINDTLYIIEQDSILYDETNFELFPIEGGRLIVF